jgi:hypothetical protein
MEENDNSQAPTTSDAGEELVYWTHNITASSSKTRLKVIADLHSKGKLSNPLDLALFLIR